LTAYVHASDAGDRMLEAKAADAVHHIGTNALPLLVKWIGYNIPKGRQKVAGFIANHVPYPAKKPLYRWAMGSATSRADAAESGIEILWAEAAPAAPGLSNVLGGWSQRASFQKAAVALSSLGNAGLAPLVGVVTNRSAPAQCRWYAAAVIRGGERRFDTNAAWAVPVLVGALDDTAVAEHAALALGQLRMEPTLSVSALTRCLQDTNHMVRRNAAQALGEFGMSASPAVPGLLNALNDRSSVVRNQATNALQRIAPQAFHQDAQ
jgi:HEAT repeat protein